MRIGIRAPASKKYLSALLEGLTAADAVFLLQHGNVPRLYESGVR